MLHTEGGYLVCVFKQQFSVFKQHFTYFHTLFHSHVFLQMFSNNNFQFLNTCTKRTEGILQTADISCSTSAFLKLKNIVRNTNYFTKKFTNY